MTWRHDTGAQNLPNGPHPSDTQLDARRAALRQVQHSDPGRCITTAPDWLRSYVHTRLAEALLNDG
eukprot:614324-Heterocapsa_arctica.AAC.1